MYTLQKDVFGIYQNRGIINIYQRRPSIQTSQFVMLKYEQYNVSLFRRHVELLFQLNLFYPTTILDIKWISYCLLLLVGWLHDKPLFYISLPIPYFVDIFVLKSSGLYPETQICNLWYTFKMSSEKDLFFRTRTEFTVFVKCSETIVV